MLALTPVPLETAGERTFFEELARWDTGGSIRAAVVASVPRFDDGPMRRRIADAVLFVPEGVAVVRVVEVDRQSGTVTASPEGAWTIGPAGRPGEVLQMGGGGSSPLDGLMRAGMDTAVRLRRAGLEPGRIARLTVLVGGVEGVLPADGDLGEGDQVATLDPRSLLLGIARVGRYVGVDNPRLWTTADVRAALEALELPGRGPSVDQLNGESFPYSPYVLRRPELLTPAALAAAPAAAAPGAAVEEPLVASPPSAAAPAPAAPVVSPPTRDTVAVAAPGPPAALDETGGIGGLFAGADRDPAPVTRGAAAPPPGASPVAPPWAERSAPTAPTAPVRSAPLPPPGVDDGTPTARRILVVAAVVLVLLAVVGLGAVRLLGGGPDPAAQPGPSVPAGGPAPQEEQVQPGDVSEVDGSTFTAQAVDVVDSCRGRAYGEVAAFFAAADCAGLSRALYATQVDGRPVVVSVSRVRMPDSARARDLQALTDTDGTGNVNDLLREGVRYRGGPEQLSGAEYASAVSGPTVTIVESSWVQPDAGSSAALDRVAGSALVLPTPPLPG